MGKYQIGEFEEVVMLAILILQDEAYGVTIKSEIENRLNRNVSLGAMRSALDRLESKGMLESKFGEKTSERGGKRKKYFKVTIYGRKSLEAVRASREMMWNAVPKISYDFAKL